MRKSVLPLGSALVALFLAVSTAGALGTSTAQDEIVAFNTNSLKYHCLSCQWAIKCTKNCVNIPKSEAIKRGGVPCKVCGGSCRKDDDSRPFGSSGDAWSRRTAPTVACVPAPWPHSVS